jgi:hypothetical protein
MSKLFESTSYNFVPSSDNDNDDVDDNVHEEIHTTLIMSETAFYHYHHQYCFCFCFKCPLTPYVTGVQ